MSSADWVWDDKELAAAFNEKTKAIIVNTPHNPLGKVFSRDELTQVADLCKKHNVLCISDEVYEWLVFDNNKHIRMCKLVMAPILAWIAIIGNSIFNYLCTCRYFAGYVESHRHHWIGWQNLLRNGMANWLGIWTQTFDQQFENSY